MNQIGLSEDKIIKILNETLIKGESIDHDKLVSAIAKAVVANNIEIERKILDVVNSKMVSDARARGLRF